MVLHLPHTEGGSGGCPRMIFGTRPHGQRPHFCSSVTSIPSRRMLPSQSRTSTTFTKLPLCCERILPTLMLLSSRHSIGSPFRYSVTGSPSGTSNLCLREDDPKRLLHYKPMSYLGKIRPHRRDEIWSASL
jgi:hypothetical protein